MCRIKERELENQLKINAREIEEFEQTLLTSLSALNKMKHNQTLLQTKLHEEAEERLTNLIKTRKKGGTRIPKPILISEALAKLKWSPEAIENALEANPGWKTKEVRI